MNLKFLSPIHQAKLDFTLENVEKGRILDVGCGGWEQNFILEKRGIKDVYGIDIDKERIKRGVIADAEKIPFKDDTFDVVTFIDVLEHMSKEKGESVIEEISRVMKPDGKLIMTVFCSKFPFSYDPLNFILRRFNRKIEDFGAWYWGHERLYQGSEVKEILKRKNFKITKFERRNHWFTCLFTNYIPFLWKKYMKKGWSKNKPQLPSPFIKMILRMINKIDKNSLSRNCATLCFVAKNS